MTRAAVGDVGEAGSVARQSRSRNVAAPSAALAASAVYDESTPSARPLAPVALTPICQTPQNTAARPPWTAASGSGAGRNSDGAATTLSVAVLTDGVNHCGGGSADAVSNSSTVAFESTRKSSGAASLPCANRAPSLCSTARVPAGDEATSSAPLPTSTLLITTRPMPPWPAVSRATHPLPKPLAPPAPPRTYVRAPLISAGARCTSAAALAAVVSIATRPPPPPPPPPDSLPQSFGLSSLPPAPPVALTRPLTATSAAASSTAPPPRPPPPDLRSHAELSQSPPPLPPPPPNTTRSSAPPPATASRGAVPPLPFAGPDRSPTGIVPCF
mmetsp:Transcript_39558/g.96855  ORF Transcript_39558/g.96855 Transcript_39558/m.96855 type:complete len:329 (+) Transcript_39558:1139-2125(+)